MIKQMNLPRVLIAHLLVLSFFSVNIQAENLSATDNSWQYSASPYLWVAGQKGNVATLPPASPIEIDVSFDDVISNLDMAFLGFFEARKGRLGLFGEVFYIGVSGEQSNPHPLFTKAGFEQDLWGVSLGASYAISQSSEHLLDIIGGVRFWDLDNTLQLTSVLERTRALSAKESWQDAFIGIKGKHWLNKQWYISGWGIIAVVGDSNSAWDVFGAAGYEYSDAVSFSAGYRYQEVDYSKNDFVFDVKISGPTLGATFRF